MGKGLYDERRRQNREMWDAMEQRGQAVYQNPRRDLFDISVASSPHWLTFDFVIVGRGLPPSARRLRVFCLQPLV